MNTLRKRPNKQEWNVWTPFDEHDQSTHIGHIRFFKYTTEEYVVNMFNCHLGDGIYEKFDTKEEAFKVAQEFTYE